MADTTARAWKATRNSKAGVFINEERVVVAGDNTNFIVADNRGITIKGPISFAQMDSERRYGGLFLGPTEFQQMIPSTIVTPGPQKFPMPPISGIGNVLADVAYFSLLLV